MYEAALCCLDTDVLGRVVMEKIFINCAWFHSIWRSTDLFSLVGASCSFRSFYVPTCLRLTCSVSPASCPAAILVIYVIG